VQAALQKDNSRRQEASLVLKKAGQKFHNAMLLQLANQAQLDAFTRVKAAIDQMVVQLQKEQKDEQAHRDWCIGERNTNDRQTEKRERDKSDLEALIDELNQKIDAMAKEIVTLEAEIKDAQIQIKRAGEDREAENKEFQTTVTDQRATQAVLGKALQVLQSFYNKTGLLQQPMNGAPPAGFKEYQKNRGSGGVMQLIQTIMSDAGRMEKEAVQAERDAQAAYETFVKDTNGDIASKQRAITNLAEDKAKGEQDRTQANDDLTAAMTELEQLAAYSAELHASCDYTVKNYDVRQTARAQEIEALQQAKAILSGASFGGAALLRRS